jgi:hypothetical protein
MYGWNLLRKLSMISENFSCLLSSFSWSRFHKTVPAEIYGKKLIWSHLSLQWSHKMALKYLNIHVYCPQYSDTFVLLVFGEKNCQKIRIKMYPKSFRPKGSFVKSIPCLIGVVIFFAGVVIEIAKDIKRKIWNDDFLCSKNEATLIVPENGTLHNEAFFFLFWSSSLSNGLVLSLECLAVPSLLA